MNFILWLQNAIHLNLSFQQTQNGGIHTNWCFTNAWKSKRWLCGIIFYKSIILKLLHSSAPEERKTNWGEKIKEKFFLLQQAQCASCCHYLPNIHIISNILHRIRNFMLQMWEKIFCKCSDLVGYCYILEYTVRSRKKLNIGWQAIHHHPSCTNCQYHSFAFIAV